MCVKMWLGTKHCLCSLGQTHAGGPPRTGTHTRASGHTRECSTSQAAVTASLHMSSVNAAATWKASPTMLCLPATHSLAISLTHHLPSDLVS